MKRRWMMAVVAGVLMLAARAWGLEAADVHVEGWKVTVAGQSLTIEPASLKSETFDATLQEGTPSWRGPTPLAGARGVFESLRPDTLVITLASDPATKLEAGKDFLLDPKWATIAGVKGSKGAPGTKVHCAYQWGMSRIDLVEKSADGKLALVKGAEDKSRPLLPAPTAGSIPLFSVYLANGTTSLSAANINIIDPSYDGVPPVERPETLQAVKAKIAAGKPVTFVFLGDSITEQGMRDFRDGKGSYVNRFAAYLQEKYPQSKVELTERGKPVAEPAEKQIRVIKAGVGGDDTPRALARIDRDVLAFKPDVVSVMLGVNDENKNGSGNGVPVAKYKANLETIVDKVRGVGAEPILMTTSMKNLGWSGTAGNLNEYAAAMRAVAADRKVCLVDNFRAWELLPKRGYNYMVFLDNGINHPIDLGHDLFARGLKAAMEADGK